MTPARKQCPACGGSKSTPNPDYRIASGPGSYRPYNSYGELYRETSDAYGDHSLNSLQYIQCETCSGAGLVEDYGEDDNG